MNILVVIMNFVLFGFTCLVLYTDGFSRETTYVFFTLLLLLVPILNMVIFYRAKGAGWFNFSFKNKTPDEQKSSVGRITKSITIISNIVLLGVACGALIDQYPHPREDGFVLFVILLFLTPVLSSVVVFRLR